MCPELLQLQGTASVLLSLQCPTASCPELLPLQGTCPALLSLQGTAAVPLAPAPAPVATTRAAVACCMLCYRKRSRTAAASNIGKSETLNLKSPMSEALCASSCALDGNSREEKQQEQLVAPDIQYTAPAGSPRLCWVAAPMKDVCIFGGGVCVSVCACV